jgi:hypothetical protein
MLYQIEKYNIPRFLKLDKLLKRKDLIVGQHTNANIRCISIRAKNERYLEFCKSESFLFPDHPQRISQICAYLF